MAPSHAAGENMAEDRPSAREKQDKTRPTMLFFSAHPDDAEFGAGGTMLKLAQKCRVVHVILTRGEAGTFGSPKEREAEEACASSFGNYEFEFLDFLDNHLDDTAENALKLSAVIRKYKPRVIFAPYHTNNSSHFDGAAHPDHLVLGKLVVKAARFAKFKNAKVTGEPHFTKSIFYYMVPRYLKPSILIDVSDKMDALSQLWACHKSQLNIKDGKVVEFLTLLRRCYGLSHSVSYAEAFLTDEPLLLEPDLFM